MPNHTVQWVNDHTQICDRLNERVILMQDYLDSKPDDFDGIAVKRFLLGQAREQVSWYRQSIDTLDFVGCVACRRRPELIRSILAGIRIFSEQSCPTAGGVCNPASPQCPNNCGFYYNDN
jgi:hypothetical protein